jgi:hypothetical protein
MKPIFDNKDNGIKHTVLAAGDLITFGTYPQTSSGDDNTPIEWLVLDVQEDKALLISKYGLDCQPYDTTKSCSLSWYESTLRDWLNTVFLNRAFSVEEQKLICATWLKNRNDQHDFYEDGTLDEDDTQDRVFLLSREEAENYLGLSSDGNNDSPARMAPTDYAIEHGAYKDRDHQTGEGKAAGGWWLRSIDGPVYPLHVLFDGSLDACDAGETLIAVRPAVWISVRIKQAQE